MDKKTPWFAYFLAIANATIIGLSFMFMKIAVDMEIATGQKVPPMDTLFFRFGLALIALIVYLKWARIPMLPHKGSWSRLLPIVLFYPLGFFIFQAFGLMSIPSSVAGILTAATPAMTAILAAFLIGDRTNVRQFGCILLSILGVLYIAWNQGARLDDGTWQGMTLILLSCLSSACYTTYNRVLIRKYSPWEITFVMMLAGTLCFMAWSLLHHARNGNVFALFRPLGNSRYSISVAYLGLFASLLTTLFSSLALRRIGPAQFVVFFNFSTVVAILAGFLFLGEKIYVFHFVGAAVIVVGVIGTNYFKTDECNTKETRENGQHC